MATRRPFRDWILNTAEISRMATDWKACKGIGAQLRYRFYQGEDLAHLEHLNERHGKTVC